MTYQGHGRWLDIDQLMFTFRSGWDLSEILSLSTLLSHLTVRPIQPVRLRARLLRTGPTLKYLVFLTFKASF